MSTSTINANESIAEADVLKNKFITPRTLTLVGTDNILPNVIGKKCLSTLQTNRPLSAWLYRKSHEIQYASGSGTDYQKRIKVFKSNEFPITLTLLNARSTLAFTIPGGSDWVERSFGTLVPLRTKVALCLVKSVTSADVYFKALSTDDYQTLYSVGATDASFDGTFFALIPVNVNRKTWTQSLGLTGALDVYVVGYITEEVVGGDTFFEMFSQDNQVITNGTATTWTDINISALKQEGGDKVIKGAYIALDCATDQDIYFRAKDSTDNGVKWEADTNDPGTHLMGFIPVNSSGIFQYKTSGNAINVYVEGLIHSCPISQADRMDIRSYRGQEMQIKIDSTWHTIIPEYAAKAYTISGKISPSYLGTFKTRPYGGTNAQNYVKKGSCAIFPLLTKAGTDNKVEYWNNGAWNDSVYLGSIIIYSAAGPGGVGESVYVGKHCKDDFGDIRFTNSNGTILLSHWMESKVDTDHAVFWVKIADDLSSSNATIYVYYDNSSATTLSNGPDTFSDLFDHFDNGSLMLLTLSEGYTTRREVDQEG